MKELRSKAVGPAHGVAKEVTLLVPPSWKNGVVAATRCDNALAISLYSREGPEKPLPTARLFEEVQSVLDEAALPLGDDNMLEFRVSRGNPPTAKLFQGPRTTGCESFFVLPADVPSRAELGWEREFLQMHRRERFYRTVGAPAVLDFLNRVGLPERGVFSFQILFPHSGPVPVEVAWPAVVQSLPRGGAHSVLGSDGVNLLCIDRNDGRVFRVDLHRAGSFIVNSHVALLAHALVLWQHERCSPASMRSWLATNDPPAIAERDSFWAEVIAEE